MKKQNIITLLSFIAIAFSANAVDNILLKMLIFIYAEDLALNMLIQTQLKPVKK